MNKPILKCAILDDSALQRLSIVRLIEKHPYLEVIVEYNNAIEAKIGLETTKIDLVFLDIEMPIMSGFALLDDLTLKPQIIFVSGKTRYAFKAFDYDALDYLHKPILKERFSNAAHKTVSNFKMKNNGTFEGILPEDRFLRIHKSYIVNLDKFLLYNSKVIELENQQVPLSRNRKSQLVKALTTSLKR